MKKETIYNIQNLFNGEMMNYIQKEKAVEYIELCLERQIPITINYYNKYVN